LLLKLLGVLPKILDHGSHVTPEEAYASKSRCGASSNWLHLNALSYAQQCIRWFCIRAIRDFS